MRKLYQKQWFGIQFSSFSDLSSRNLASSEFYARFYEEFFRKFKSFDDLPNDWKNGKHEVAEHLSTLIHGRSRVLSIGCGNGYIEQCLVDKHCYQGSLTALEPNIACSQWVNTDRINLVHGQFPDAISDMESYDFAYASGIDYVFTDYDYLKFLMAIRKSGIKDFLLTIVFTPDTSFKGTVHHWFSWLASRLHLRKQGQLWGYLRTPMEHRLMIKKAGLFVVEAGEYQYGPRWFRLKPMI